MKVISYNLGLDLTNPKLNGSNSVIYLGKLLEEENPDLIGTQQGTVYQLLELSRLFPQYQVLGFSEFLGSTDNYCAILYHQDKLRCLATGNCYLSKRSSLSKKGLQRIGTWATLEVIEETQKITIFNTHLDSEDIGTKINGSELIWDRLSQEPSDTFFLLTSDFYPSSDSVVSQIITQPLLNGIQLQDFYHESSANSSVIRENNALYYDSRLNIKSIGYDSDRFNSKSFEVCSLMAILESG